jgi:protein TonB
MLRLSLLLSVGVHLLILGITSVFVARQVTPHELLIEKRFQVTLQKNIAAPTASPAKQPDEAPFKHVNKPLTRTSQDFPVSSSTLRPGERATIAQMKPFVPMQSRVIEKHSPAIRPVQPIIPKTQEFIAKAHDFPTPIPAKPTPVPTAPNHVSASLPESKEQPQPVEMPGSTTATTVVPSSPSLQGSSTTGTTTGYSSNSRGVEGDTGNESGVQEIDRSTTQREKTLLNRYLQEVAAKIHAVKQYPRKARKEGWEGTVVIKLHILPTGKVEKIELAEKSQYDVLNEAALQAITKAQPFPKFYHGLSMQSMTLKVPIQFTLEKR